MSPSSLTGQGLMSMVYSKEREESYCVRKWPMGASFHRTIIECERIFVPELLEDEVEPVAVVEAGTIVSYSSNLQDEKIVSAVGPG